jgi:tetratricopeptide (TPR) repeat protein
LFLLLALECVLRLAGYGYSTAFFSKTQAADGKEYLTDSETFSLRFFPPALQRWPGPFRIPLEKPKDTRRIFVFGESAAMGDPQPIYGASRYLEVLLRERFPARKLEVVNLGITAINSHVILPMAQEVAARGRGDIWILYIGNNEMVGPFGAATVFGARSPPLWMARLHVAAQQWRVGQLAMALARRLAGKAGSHTAWTGMQMFLENQIAPEDPHKERVYDNFEKNLRGILRAARQAGAKVILSTVSVNLRDCPPFASALNSNQPPGRREQFDALYREAREFQSQGNFVEASRCFEEAAPLNPRFAELRYRWGLCLLQTTNLAAAREQLQAACDSDALPFRADGRINSTIRALGKEFASDNLVLCDAESEIRDASPAGVAGEESFFEHVHLNFSGNYRLASGWAAQVERFLPPETAAMPPKGWATQEACERELGLSDFNRADVLQLVARRMDQPPFSSQFDNPRRLERIRTELAAVRTRMQQPGADAKARDLFGAALAHSPEDPCLYEGLGNFLESVGDYTGAGAAYGRCSQMQPQDFYGRLRLGTVLAKQGRFPEAIELLRQSARIRPGVPDAWFEMARAQELSGDYEEALRSFDRACQLRPQDPTSQYYRLRCSGKLLGRQNRHREAMDQYRKAIELLPGNWEAHFELGGELDAANEIDKARGEFAEAVRLNPDYFRAHLNYGVLLAKLGRLDEAQREFEETLRLEPANRSAQQYLAQIKSMKTGKR